MTPIARVHHILAHGLPAAALPVVVGVLWVFAAVHR